jgi:hypothetical protein
MKAAIFALRAYQDGIQAGYPDKYLKGSGETRICNDCTDYVLPLDEGMKFP